MAQHSLPQNPHAGQITDRPSNALQLQRKINQCHRELEEANIQLLYHAARHRLLMAEIDQLMAMKEDAMNAGLLAQRAAGAVAEAERLMGGGL